MLLDLYSSNRGIHLVKGMGSDTRRGHCQGTGKHVHDDVRLFMRDRGHPFSVIMFTADLVADKQKQS